MVRIALDLRRPALVRLDDVDGFAAAMERLRGMDPAWREELGARIAARLWSLPAVRDSKVILLYASLPTEVNAYPTRQPDGYPFLHERRPGDGPLPDGGLPARDLHALRHGLDREELDDERDPAALPRARRRPARLLDAGRGHVLDDLQVEIRRHDLEIAVAARIDKQRRSHLHGDSARGLHQRGEVGAQGAGFAQRPLDEFDGVGEVLSRQPVLPRLVHRPVELVASLDDGEKSRELEALLQDIATMSDKISYRRDDDASARKPSFGIVRSGTDIDVRFAAIPLGHEFTSLVLALLWVGGHPPKIADDLAEQVRALESAAPDGKFRFETYMSLSCQSCPDTVQALNLMSVLNPNIQHVAIDGALFQDEVEAREIMSVPTVYLNGEPFDAGRMTVEQVAGNVVGRSDAEVASGAGRHGGAVESGPGDGDEDPAPLRRGARLPGAGTLGRGRRRLVGHLGTGVAVGQQHAAGPGNQRQGRREEQERREIQQVPRIDDRRADERGRHRPRERGGIA